MRLLSLYIHIPFCKRRCLYCSFFSRPKDHVPKAYLDAIKKEFFARIRQGFIDENAKVKSLYFGGGTPSLLKLEQIKNIFFTLSSIFNLKDIEATFEANPEDLSRSYIEDLIDAGINRISLGVQSFLERDLVFLGRRHSVNDSLLALRHLSDVGVNFNIDLIFGLPSQTKKDWLKNLEIALEFSPPHISTYELTIEEGTGFYKMFKKGRLQGLCEDRIVGLYEEGLRFLEEKGYIHYEVSNFCLPGFLCVHNMNYWERGKYIGLGTSACSFHKGKLQTRWCNICDIGAYMKVCEKYPDIEILSNEERLLETLFLSFRTKKGLDLKKLEDEFGIKILQEKKSFLEALFVQNLIELDDKKVLPTEKGMLLADRLALELFHILSETEVGGDKWKKGLDFGEKDSSLILKVEKLSI